MKIILYILVVLAAYTQVMADSFNKIKQNLARQGCYQIEFINIIESDVFDIVDTTKGNLLVSSENLYKLDIADDVFMADSLYSYNYSAENNQVIIEKRALGDFDEISFITRLDDLYETQTKEVDFKYYLKKRPEVKGDYPDSMVVTIDKNNLRLKQIEYFDVNEDLNRVLIMKQEFLGQCDLKAFEPKFPKDCERIKL